MFPLYFTPELLQTITKYNNRPTYTEYYNKRYLEECKPFYTFPTLSLHGGALLHYIQQGLESKIKKEYIEKYGPL